MLVNYIFFGGEILPPQKNYTKFGLSYFAAVHLYFFTMTETDTLSVKLMVNDLFLYKQVGIIMLALMDCSLYELSLQPLKICEE